MTTILSVIQIVVSIVLIIAILLQSSSAGLGGAFGGSDNVDAGYHTRRGFEKVLFNGTIVLGITFAVLSLVIFLLN
jgi:preprotein translocase subunit SecG